MYWVWDLWSHKTFFNMKLKKDKEPLGTLIGSANWTLLVLFSSECSKTDSN